MRARNQYIAGAALLLLIAAGAALSAFGRAPSPRFSEQKILFEPIENPPNPFRKTLWLNGHWEFRIGAGGEWNTVAVPHVWNSVPGLENYEGPAEYRIEFIIDEDWAGESPILHFEGVAGAVEILINDIKAAKRPSRPTPFEVDISQHVVSPGRNELRALVDNRPAGPRLSPAGEKNFGGIFREVFVEFRRPLRFEEVRAGAKAAAGEDWATSTARVTARVAAPDGEAQIFGRINPEEGWGGSIFDSLLSSDSSGYAYLDWQGDLTQTIRWSPENPQIYKAGLVAVTPEGMTDGAQKYFGVREFKRDKKGFLLNGERVKLDGVAWRTHFGDGWGPVATREAAARDIEFIRAAGFNAVRFVAPPHPELLSMCDRAGLLVFEELPFSGKLRGGESAYVELEAALDEMVARDESHPSVVAWGLGRNIDVGDAATAAAVERLAARLKKADPGRLVYAGTRGVSLWKAPKDIDFYAFEEYAGWTGRSTASLKRALTSKRAAESDRPLVLLAYGAGADSREGAAGLKGSQLHQYFVIAGVRDAMSAAKNVGGGFIDSLADYEGPALGGPRGERHIASVGLLDEDRKPKLAYQQLSGAGRPEDVSWRWSRLRFRLPGAELALLAAAALAGFSIWSGFGRVWQALVEPEELRPFDGDLQDDAKSFLLFGLPMLIAGAAAMSFAASAAMDLRPLDPAVVSPAVVSAAKLWMQPLPVRLALMFILQIFFATAAGMTSAAILGVEPLKIFELSARCSALRMLFVFAPFIPIPLWSFAVLIAGWEMFVLTGAVSRTLWEPTDRAAVAVVAGFAAAAALIAALALFILTVIL
jgi:hypothetical protein